MIISRTDLRNICNGLVLAGHLGRDHAFNQAAEPTVDVKIRANDGSDRRSFFCKGAARFVNRLETIQTL